MNILLGKSNEILVVGVHVGKLAVYQHHDLVLARLLFLTDVGGDDSLGLFSQAGIALHLTGNISELASGD